MNNFYLSCKECVLEGPRSFYGCFYLGPFNNSQSLTVANALRRTLLSEISGLGILNAQIEGVKHEYSTFLGIRESILDLLLNLKEIVFCYSSDFDIFNTLQDNKGVAQKINGLRARSAIHEQKNFSSTVTEFKNSNNQKIDGIFIGYLQVTGPGIVRASDFKLPSFLKCVDPDQYIATLSENGKLNLKIEISEKNFSGYRKDKNFQSSLNKKKIVTPYAPKRNSATPAFGLEGKFKEHVPDKKTLKVDSVFSPIKKVNYTIEHYGTFVAGVQFKNNTFLTPSVTPLTSARGSARGALPLPLAGQANAVGADNEFQTKHLERMNPNNQVIFLELWTNGSIHPRVALYEALSILNSTFSKLEKMKILNDVYIKSIFKSNQNYSKIVRKTLSNLIHLPSVALPNPPLGSGSLNKEKQVSPSLAASAPLRVASSLHAQSAYPPKGGYKGVAQLPPKGVALRAIQGKEGTGIPLRGSITVHLNQSKENSNSMVGRNFSQNQLIEKNLTFTSFDKLKLIYLDKKEKNLINEFYSIKILNLPFRIENCLIQANIITLSDLFNKTSNDFKQIPGLGNQSFSFLQKKLFVFLYTCSSAST